MSTSKLTLALAALPMFALAACSADTIDSDDAEMLDVDAIDHPSLEQQLHLIPQLLRATDIPGSGRTLAGDVSRYLILSPEAGEIDIDTIAIADDQNIPRSLTALFTIPPSVSADLRTRDALLLIAAPELEVDALCARFQSGHDKSDLVKSEGQKLLYVATASAAQVHALCLLPPDAQPGTKGKGQGTANAVASQGDPENYGAGSYTVRIKTLKCNDPRDWETWPYNGDEARMRGFYDGLGGEELWSKNNVKSGNVFSPNRYVHFTNNVQIELFDYDSAPWNASDKLGTESIYSQEACAGDHYGDFDGNGGGHSWNYDMTYRVYGPSCPCQSQEPAIYQASQQETCSVTSTSITNYTYYCNNGIQWRQAWGNRTRHCDTYDKTYNDSCEMHTFVSSTLVLACDHYDTGVAIGSPTNYGTCPSPPDPCAPWEQAGEESADLDQLVAPPECTYLAE